MDTYFPKTRRPTVLGSLKRPPQSVTPPKAAKIPNPPSTPSTPKDARITRPKQPPPLRRKLQPTASTEKKRPIKLGDLFSTVHQPETTPKKDPLKGVSSTLIDLIRAKEAAAKKEDPEHMKRMKLLGIAPQIVRIIPTVFTASKKEYLPYDKIIDKCCKGLKSNYASQTIIECIDLLDKITPEWISIVEISRGRYMRYNKDKYTIAQLLEAIRRFKTNC